jgi:hypothetical protein
MSATEQFACDGGARFNVAPRAVDGDDERQGSALGGAGADVI